MGMQGRALITGASAGIGLELAREFARHGHDVILVARDGEKLAAIARALRADFGVDALVLPQDLAAADGAAALAANIREQGLEVDILVNNAGVGVHGPFVGNDAAREKTMMRVNQEVPVELCRLLLPGMLARRRGWILNVASTAAYQPGPRMALYHAGKAFLLSFGNALRIELRNTGVTVTNLCPGPTRSDFQRRMGVRDGAWVQRISMPAAAVARAGYRALERGRAVEIPGLSNKLGAALGKIFPWPWGARVVGVIQAARKRGAPEPT